MRKRRATKLYDEWIGKGTTELYKQWKKAGVDHNEKLKDMWDTLLLKKKDKK